MTKKYKHIHLPKKLISKESAYTPPVRKFFTTLIFDKNKQKNLLASGLIQARNHYNKKKTTLKLREDKHLREVHIKFNGPSDKKFISKYRIGVYRKEMDKDDNESLFGFISDKKLKLQKNSDYERLGQDVEGYIRNDALHSYYDKVKSIKPLTLNEILEKDLKKSLKQNPNKKVIIDISFAGNREKLNKKLSLIKKEYGNNFITEINSETLHFCRIKANYSDVKNIAQNYDGVIFIEFGPQYIFLQSSMMKDVSNLIINPPTKKLSPAFIFDGPINENHKLLRGAVVGFEGSKTGNDTEKWHATAVSGLVVYGMQVENGGSIQQENTIISANVIEDDFFKIDSRIEDYVKKLSKKHSLLIINLSVNSYPDIYNRKKNIDKLSILLDELAHVYNCIFIISVGNLFQTTGQDFIDKCKQLGYPKHFCLGFSRILPPSDSINNVSVGSITFQESVNSITKIQHPSAHTRGNLDKNPFIKPDVVHYDSNFNKDFEPEYNGISLAANTNEQLTKSYGTSFSTPLITNFLARVHNYYPEYNNNTLKALLIHFSESVAAETITDRNIKDMLLGFGMPSYENAINSLSHSSTIIIEDSITIGKTKTIKFPVPSCISGSHTKRLKIRKTLVYNPKINPSNPRLYNPINISAQLLRDDQAPQDSYSTRKIYDGAHQKSNVKKYPAKEFSTKKHVGDFWYIKVICDLRDEDFVENDYQQKYSIILTIEDIQQEKGIDLHEEINNMIEIETSINIPIEIESE